MLYVGNAFSLQMVQDCTVRVESISLEDAQVLIDANWVDVAFCIGHADTAAVACSELNTGYRYHGNSANKLTVEEVFQRRNINLNAGDVLLVLQVTGGRLPEGCTELPEGIQLQWRKVTVR
jgi:hypothetical protein